MFYLTRFYKMLKDMTPRKTIECSAGNLKARVFLFTGPLLLSSLLLVHHSHAQAVREIIFTPAPVSAALPATLNTQTPATPATFTDVSSFFTSGNLQLAQADFQFVDDIDTAQVQQQIDTILGNEGAYSNNLIDGLIDVGRLYRQDGQIQQSIEALETAQQLTRIEYGLFSPRQIPIMKELADSYLFNGEIIKARSYYNRYYTMETAQHVNDIDRRIQAQINRGDDLLNMAQYAEAHHLGSIPELIGLHFDAYRSYQLAVRNLYTLSNTDQNARVISQLQKVSMVSAYYLATKPKDEIDTLNRLIRSRASAGATAQMQRQSSSVGRPALQYEGNGKFASTRSRPTLGTSRTMSLGQGVGPEEMNPCYSSFENSQRCQRRDQYSFLTGYFKDAGLSLLTMDIASDARATNQGSISIAAALDLADWHEVVENRKEARDIYTQAYHAVQSSGSEDTEVILSNFFSPALPIQIPVFIDHEHSPDSFSSNELAASKMQGFIDVSFRLDRYGKASRVKVKFASPDLDESYKDLLTENILSNQYRPYIENGRPVSNTFTVRYYVSTLG